MTIPKQPITEADWERISDVRVLDRLRKDPRYQHAASADEQAEAEDAIGDEVQASMRRDYRIEGES